VAAEVQYYVEALSSCIGLHFRTALFTLGN